MTSTPAPNILLITTDQQRFDALGINGGKDLRTPFLDHLAARGVNFRRGYTTCPVCMPARRSLISGLHPASHGTIHNTEGQAFTPPATLPGLMRDAGYQTQLVGKLHVGTPGVRMGYDHMFQSETPNDRRETSHQRRNDYADWFDDHAVAPHTMTAGVMSCDRGAREFPHAEQYHQTSWVTEQAARFLTRYRDPSCPFFMHLSYWAPHPPFVPPAAYFNRQKHNSWTPTIGDWVGDREPQMGLAPSSMRGPFRPEEMQEAAAGYFGLIDHVDDQLNMLVDRWRSSRLWEPDRPTWVIFTSDHGEMLGDHQLRRKCWPYEGSMHVPFFIAPLHLPGGGVQARQVDDFACLEDVLPTVCDLAGIAIPEHLQACDGRSLANILQGESGGRSELHAECMPGPRHYRVLLHGPWKYIRWTKTGEEQLFNVQVDPAETVDRSGEEDLTVFRQLVDDHRARSATAGYDDDDVDLQPCAGACPRTVFA